MTAKAKMETAFFYGFPITTFGNDKKEENGFIFFDFGTQNMEMRDYAKNLLILVCCKLHKKLHQQ